MEAPLEVLEADSGWVSSMVLSPEGKPLALGSYNIVRLWNAATGVPLQVLDCYSGWVYTVVFSPDSKKLVFCSENGTLWLWDTAKRAALQEFEGHSNKAEAIPFSLDGKLASGSRDGPPSVTNRRLTASDGQEGNRRDCSMSGNQTSGKEGGVQYVVLVVCMYA